MPGLPTLLDNTPIPSLIYGTARRPNQLVAPDIAGALRIGHRALDLASSRYHHDEAADGAALLAAATAAQLRRQTLFLQSKYAPPESQAENKPWPYEPHDEIRTQVLSSVRRSAADLGGLGVLDAYMLHSPLGCVADMMEAWRALEELVARGAVRYLGICNVSAARLRELYDRAEVKPMFVQGWFRPKTGYDGEVVSFCRERGIVYQAFGVFDEFNEHLFECAPVKERASARAVTAHQALLEMLFLAAERQGLRLCILDGSRDIEHMKQNLAAAGAIAGIKAMERNTRKKPDQADDAVDSFTRLVNWVV